MTLAMEKLNIDSDDDLHLQALGLEIRILQAQEKAALACLQTEVVATLQNPDTYVPMTAGEIDSILGDTGVALGIWQQKRLVGLYSARNPCPYIELLQAAGIDAAQQETTAYTLAILVHPDWRGRGLQRIMGRTLKGWIDSHWQPRYHLVVVHPANIPSIREQFSQGMQAVKLVQMFAGKPRLVFCVDNQAPLPAPGETLLVPLHQTDKLKAVLDLGWRGWALEKVDDTDFMRLVR